jgi:hypothetical protein
MRFTTSIDLYRVGTDQRKRTLASVKAARWAEGLAETSSTPTKAAPYWMASNVGLGGREGESVIERASERASESVCLFVCVCVCEGHRMREWERVLR